jgi:hypothetical protein
MMLHADETRDAIAAAHYEALSKITLYGGL